MMPRSGAIAIMSLAMWLISLENWFIRRMGNTLELWLGEALECCKKCSANCFSSSLGDQVKTNTDNSDS